MVAAPTDCPAYGSAVCCGPCRTAQLAAHVLKWRFLPSISFLAATLTLGLLLYIPFNPTFPVLPYFQFKEVLYMAGFTFLISLWILTCCIIGAVRNRIREAEGMATSSGARPRSVVRATRVVQHARTCPGHEEIVSTLMYLN